jgi:RHH-type proline utilization regulon transcriptional repressor/proline dehydrogenase/delta 1-pyrroline-5-carboxylate dehydrogenase
MAGPGAPSRFGADRGATAATHSRAAIAAAYLADEAALVDRLARVATLQPVQKVEVAGLARDLVDKVRAGRRQAGGIDEFMAEFALSSEEGVVLMCLAEALLRVPDADTADRLIADKIGGRDWRAHLGHSPSLFVNASTWGLMLTGEVVQLGAAGEGDGFDFLARLVARSGEPVIRQAMRQAMRILGRQFVLGRTIAEALDEAAPWVQRGYRFSFDMLGEAAVTAGDAERYFAAYHEALETVGRADLWRGSLDAPAEERPSVSVKLSALDPRCEPMRAAALVPRLSDRLTALARTAHGVNVGLTIDAEEADRLDLSLAIFEHLVTGFAATGWDGIGLAVQAYGRRALPVLEWIVGLAGRTGRRIPVRLVKGAYWDSEIKRAQIAGLQTYPVFTRKASTDVSYLACARFMIENAARLHPQFATHNAQTLASVKVRAAGTGIEIQRLHGMGQALHRAASEEGGLGLPSRIYAPVGSHQDLLAYLVRRLLENGANTSFVNRLADDRAPVDDIIADPVDLVAALDDIPHPAIPAPGDLFRPERANSGGMLLSEPTVRGPLLSRLRASIDSRARAGALVAGERAPGGAERAVAAPHDPRLVVGSVSDASEADIDRALGLGVIAQQDWDRRGGGARAEMLERAADLVETHREKLMALMMAEAGKTVANALGDVREAADFLRYYAARARAEFSGPVRLPGPTGEANETELHGRGVFACISPWNFPLAIFTGQVAGALAAGNAVAAKPAEQTSLVAAAATRLMHEAGVPGEVLALLPGDGPRVGARLIADPRTAGVAFTGGTETARAIARSLAARDGPLVPLIAETGGLNAMIVDSTALPEQAVRDAIGSAFDSAGQRCSALRVMCVQGDIAGRIIDMLAGAMDTLIVGSPFDETTDVGPVIDEEARGRLEEHKAAMRASARVIRELELPEAAGHGTFVAPAAYEIGSPAEIDREVFGPVLHVLRFEASRLDQLVDFINGWGYGLTLGVHTRIETRARDIAARARVGNVYVNRNQIGAVVGAQPFGGEGLSGTGPKAGGALYLHRFATERTRSTDTTASGGNTTLLSLASADSPEGLVRGRSTKVR